jgi:hypothetical protein
MIPFGIMNLQVLPDFRQSAPKLHFSRSAVSIPPNHRAAKISIKRQFFIIADTGRAFRARAMRLTPSAGTVGSPRGLTFEAGRTHAHSERQRIAVGAGYSACDESIHNASSLMHYFDIFQFFHFFR